MTPAEVAPPAIVRRFITDPNIDALIANWPDVAWSALARLRHQRRRSPFDTELENLVAETEHALATVPAPVQPPSEFVVCPWFRIDGAVIRTIGMVARFEPASEIHLDELRIELTYPLDAAAERFFRRAASEARTPGPGSGSIASGVTA